jgi:hypothetical protein
MGRTVKRGAPSYVEARRPLEEPTMIHIFAPTTALLLATLAASPAQAWEPPEVYLLGETSVLRTPMAYYGYGRDNVVPINAGLRASFEWPTGDKRRVFNGLTVRAGRAAIGNAMLQARMDSGYRRFFQGGERARPFLELGMGFEGVWLRDGDSFDVGAGPSLGFGWRLGPDEQRTVLGARATSALIPGGYGMDSDDYDNEANSYGYDYMPSNVSLALYLGRVF